MRQRTADICRPGRFRNVHVISICRRAAETEERPLTRFGVARCSSGLIHDNNMRLAARALKNNVPRRGLRNRILASLLPRSSIIIVLLPSASPRATLRGDEFDYARIGARESPRSISRSSSSFLATFSSSDFFSPSPIGPRLSDSTRELSGPALLRKHGVNQLNSSSPPLPVQADVPESKLHPAKSTDTSRNLVSF